MNYYDRLTKDISFDESLILINDIISNPELSESDTKELLTAITDTF